MPLPSPLPTAPTLSSTSSLQRSVAPIAEREERSSLVSRNVTIGEHHTSIRLEPDMWNGLREICRREHMSIHEIATAVSLRKPPQFFAHGRHSRFRDGLFQKRLDRRRS